MTKTPTRTLGAHLGEVHITLYENGFKVDTVSADPVAAPFIVLAKHIVANALLAKFNEYERTTTNKIN